MLKPVLTLLEALPSSQQLLHAVRPVGRLLLQSLVLLLLLMALTFLALVELLLVALPMLPLMPPLVPPMMLMMACWCRASYNAPGLRHADCDCGCYGACVCGRGHCAAKPECGSHRHLHKTCPE